MACVCVCVQICARVCVRASVRACVRMRVCALVCACVRITAPCKLRDCLICAFYITFYITCVTVPWVKKKREKKAMCAVVYRDVVYV